MAQLDDLEFQKVGTLLRPQNWEVVRQEIQGNDLVVVLKKPRPAGAVPPEGAGAPAGDIPT